MKSIIAKLLAFLMSLSIGQAPPQAVPEVQLLPVLPEEEMWVTSPVIDNTVPELPVKEEQISDYEDNPIVYYDPELVDEETEDAETNIDYPAIVIPTIGDPPGPLDEHGNILDPDTGEIIIPAENIEYIDIDPPLPDEPDLPEDDEEIWVEMEEELIQMYPASPGPWSRDDYDPEQEYIAVPSGDPDDPFSLMYPRFLTPEEYEAEFGVQEVQEVPEEPVTDDAMSEN